MVPQPPAPPVTQFENQAVIETDVGGITMESKSNTVVSKKDNPKSKTKNTNLNDTKQV